ncbi:MAG: NAD(P)-binding domain-containing protein [Bacteroidales bacterium]|jgi:shikimate dehydrogenase|nr:NAD(P)-binding domain-containing protein [Bacteroidales bacterium]
MTVSQTKLFAVTGRPVIHSKSPGMFRSVFAHEQIDAAYFRLAAKHAKQAVFMYKHMGLSGMNVTAPYKEDMLRLVDVIHDEAKIIGSINTIVTRDGKLHGYNTDYFGVTQSFKDAGISIAGKKCVVIGAGGAGKAAAYGLVKEGAELTIVNRTFGKAGSLAQKLNCACEPIENLNALLETHDIIVSALSQHVNPVNADALRKRHIVFDANYTDSQLITDARARNCMIVSADDWLVNQAQLAYFHFLGTMPHTQLLRAGLDAQALGDKKHTIATIGLMGSGKTSHGRVLAEKIGYDFKDTDDEIVVKEQRSISDIFAQDGEAHFRKLERNELASGFNSPNPTLLSCGGGIVTHEENRKVLNTNSLVVWLFATPQAIIARTNIQKRPLLQVADPEKKLEEIYAERKGMYAETADIVFSTEKKMKDTNADIIIQELEHIGICKQ